jgi:hypothetical protein
MRDKCRFLGRTFYELRCHCCKARSLMASDETGLSDPYLSITVGNQTQTTPVYCRIFGIFFKIDFVVFHRFSSNHYVHNGI